MSKKIAKKKPNQKNINHAKDMKRLMAERMDQATSLWLEEQRAYSRDNPNPTDQVTQPEPEAPEVKADKLSEKNAKIAAGKKFLEESGILMNKDNRANLRDLFQISSNNPDDIYSCIGAIAVDDEGKKIITDQLNYVKEGVSLDGGKTKAHEYQTGNNPYGENVNELVAEKRKQAAANEIKNHIYSEIPAQRAPDKDTHSKSEKSFLHKAKEKAKDIIKNLNFLDSETAAGQTKTGKMARYYLLGTKKDNKSGPGI